MMTQEVKDDKKKEPLHKWKGLFEPSLNQLETLNSLSRRVYASPYSVFLDAAIHYGQIGGATGFILGGAKEARLVSYQMFAEHQHIIMAKKSDWYTYFKMKNYKMLSGFIVGGTRLGFKLGCLCSFYALLEKGIECIRGYYYLHYYKDRDDVIAQFNQFKARFKPYYFENDDSIAKHKNNNVLFWDDSWNTCFAGTLFGSLFGAIGPHRMTNLVFGIRHGFVIGGSVSLLKELYFKYIQTKVEQ